MAAREFQRSGLRDGLSMTESIHSSARDLFPKNGIYHLPRLCANVRRLVCNKFFPCFPDLARRCFLIYDIQTSPRIYTARTMPLPSRDINDERNAPGERRDITREFAKITLSSNTFDARVALAKRQSRDRRGGTAKNLSLAFIDLIDRAQPRTFGRFAVPSCEPHATGRSN